MPQVSVYTPTHSLEHLTRAWQSLQAQTCQDFEWILVPNGPVFVIPPGEYPWIFDERVKIFPASILTGKIGALKGYAVAHARSNLFVELDHDDELYPRALQTLLDAADTAKPQFLFSDFASVTDQPAPYTPYTYSPDFGWETYPTHWNGYTLAATRSFAACPVSLGYLPFAPNHVRAITRVAYEACGGYDAKLLVADDFGLMTQAYLHGADFIRVPECLYIYHLHAENTSTHEVKQNDIQLAQQEIANDNNTKLVDEWCRRNGLDSYELSVSEDTESPYPVLNPLSEVVSLGGQSETRFSELSQLADNSVGQLVLNHLLPFLGRELIVPCFAECFRVLAPGGWMRCQYPSTGGRGAWLNPHYLSHWNPATFWSFTRRKYAERVFRGPMRFYEARSWEFFPTDEYKSANILMGQTDLVALKGQRQPGWVDI